MKRTRIELAAVVAYDNLAFAALKAARAKRERNDVIQFFAHFDDNLRALQSAAYAGRLPYGVSHSFTIYDPKQRRIHAACFADRVLHHALMNWMEPVFERSLVPTTYACRPNKGTLAAVHQVQQSMRRYPWYVKIDIEHYFDAIDHRILFELIRRRFKGTEVLELIWRVISVYQTAPGIGLPIGSLSSQHFANIYLDGLDRLLLEQLKASAYVRYMDDIVWWVESRAQAKQSLQTVIAYLQQQRALRVKPGYV